MNECKVLRRLVGRPVSTPDREIHGRHGGGFLAILFGTVEYDGRVQRMLEVLSRFGRRVTLVDAAGLDNHIQLPLQGVDRVCVRLPRRLGRATPHLKFLWSVLATAYRVKPEVVVAEDFFTTGAAWLAAKLVGAQLVYDAHELIIPEGTQALRWRTRFWYGLERWVVRRASAIVAANPERAELMARHYGLPETPTYMRNIPPLPRGSEVCEDISVRNPQVSARGGSERIVLYQGAVSLRRGLSRFVEALAFLPSEYRMIVAGDGPDVEYLKRLAESWLQDGRFVALGRVPHLFLHAVAKRAHVGIVSYPATGLNNIYCSPNKVFEYAQAGLPVVATDQPPLRAVVERYGIGRVVHRGDGPEQIALCLQDVAEHKPSYRSYLERFLEDHRWENEADRVYNALAKALPQMERRS